MTIALGIDGANGHLPKIESDERPGLPAIGQPNGSKPLVGVAAF